MIKQKIKNKLVFLGDTNSINIEIVIKSFNFLKNKLNYILICNKKDLIKNPLFRDSKLILNEILDPLSFKNYKRNYLNIFNVEDISNRKYKNLLNQIQISNIIANLTKYDLVTMPINKDIFKKEMEFIGMTEYLGDLNKKPTAMLMYGDKFSVIPITTHINIKNVNRYIEPKHINFYIKNIFKNLTKIKDTINFNEINFLCYNPHCGENGSLGKEDILLRKIIKKFRSIKGPLPADSAFINIKKKTLFISTYHDQALIPFKIINKKSFNLTLGLDYKRLSPSHGTAKDIKRKYIANNKSYLTCQLF